MASESSGSTPPATNEHAEPGKLHVVEKTIVFDRGRSKRRKLQVGRVFSCGKEEQGKENWLEARSDRDMPRVKKDVQSQQRFDEDSYSAQTINSAFQAPRLA